MSKTTSHSKTRLLPSTILIITMVSFSFGLIAPVITLWIWILNTPTDQISIDSIPVEQPQDSIIYPFDTYTYNGDLITAHENIDLDHLPNTFVDTHRDVYYVDLFGESHLIAGAEYPPTCKHADSTTFCQREYIDAIISPNNQFILLEALCWEESCHRIYDIANATLHDLTASTLEVMWLADGRIRASGGFITPRIIPSGTWESTSSETPWILEKVSEN